MNTALMPVRTRSQLAATSRRRPRSATVRSIFPISLGPAALRRPPTCPGIGRAAHHSTFRAVATCQRPRPDVWDTPRRHHGLLRIRPCSPRNSALSRAATGKGAHVQSGRQSSPAGLSAIRTSVGFRLTAPARPRDYGYLLGECTHVLGTSTRAAIIAGLLMRQP
jgi:hypothetical protein